MVIVETLLRKENGEENGEKLKHNYIYRLVKNNFDISTCCGEIEVQAYGIEVERQDLLDGSIVGIERDVIKNISPQRYKVRNLMKLLYDNVVSPIHLVDILGEYIDEYIMDFDEELKSRATC